MPITEPFSYWEDLSQWVIVPPRSWKTVIVNCSCHMQQNSFQLILYRIVVQQNIIPCCNERKAVQNANEWEFSPDSKLKLWLPHSRTTLFMFDIGPKLAPLPVCLTLFRLSLTPVWLSEEFVRRRAWSLAQGQVSTWRNVRMYKFYYPHFKEANFSANALFPIESWSSRQDWSLRSKSARDRLHFYGVRKM